MMNPEILFYIIKLAVNGLVTFFAILLLSRMRSAAWMSIICGFLCSYAGTVWGILIELGILSETGIFLFRIPLSSLLNLCLPALFFIIGFIIMLSKNNQS